MPYPGFQSINMSTNEANSHYNALQVDLNSQIRTLTMRAYYTLSHTVDPTLGKRSMQLMAEQVMPRVNAAIAKAIPARAVVR